jgi:hypothetical protein
MIYVLVMLVASRLNIRGQHFAGVLLYAYENPAPVTSVAGHAYNREGEVDLWYVHLCGCE